MVQVWDRFVRLFHWTLALSLVIAWFSAQSFETLHMWAGYAAGALVALRVAWGFAGAGHARFAQFVRRPGTVLSYLRDVASGREARFVGHNPAGGAMILALLSGLIASAFTGWMLTTDALWGVQWAQRLHSLVAHGLLLLVLGHLVGVALASFRHRENLVRAMIVGRKRAPEAGDVA